MANIYDVIIIGTGPAGLCAGIYCGRANLKTLLVEKESLGGQVNNIELVENYPGFDTGVPGADLAASMMNQATSVGPELEMSEVLKVEAGQDYHIVRCSSGDFFAKTIIVASGSHHRHLNVPGENEFLHKGVFYCAVCDGGPYANKVVAVAGGGDAGITEALYQSRISAKVIVYEALPACSASNILLERARANPKLEIYCGMKIEKISGDSTVREITLSDQSGVNSTMHVDGVLVHIGVIPNSDIVKDVLTLNPQGQIAVDDRLRTSVPGIFAAGDVRAASPCQVVTAAGDGAAAALAAQKYLNGIV